MDDGPVDHINESRVRSGIFAGEDPFAITRSWLDEARETELNDPDAVALSTVDADGLPNVRVVLMRRIEEDAFVFFTNWDSAKGQEIASAGKAAFVFHWKSLRRQVRVRGIATRDDGPVSDEYYAGRALQSRIGAWASEQSRPLENRATLLARVAKLGVKHGANPPRPPFWGGIRIQPLEFEFWADGAFRLHDRFRWRRQDLSHPWQIDRLNP